MLQRMVLLTGINFPFLEVPYPILILISVFNIKA
jgi:hypothetical protein